MDMRLDDTETESTLINSNNTNIKDYAEELNTGTENENLKATVYVLFRIHTCLFLILFLYFNFYVYLYFFFYRDPNLTKISQMPYNTVEINEHNLTSTKISNEIDCHDTSIQQAKEEYNFGEKVKKISNGYAETSLDEATNYSLLCEDDDNGEKASTGDTTQTYCTEGTPYNFSNAASYTDLRKCGSEDKVITS